MEKILYSANLRNFEKEGEAFTFIHGENTVNIDFDDIQSITLESNMSAKSGAYVLLTLDTNDISLVIESEHPEFFDLLFDILCVELDVNMDEVFNISVANTKTKRTVYQKKQEE